MGATATTDKGEFDLTGCSCDMSSDRDPDPYLVIRHKCYGYNDAAYIDLPIQGKTNSTFFV
jgi:hypothetical protein